MIYDSFPFDPLKDIAEVDQFGFVNLHDAVLHGSLPSDLKADVNKFNEFELEQIGGHVRDNFDVIEQGRNLNKALASATEQSEE